MKDYNQPNFDLHLSHETPFRLWDASSASARCICALLSSLLRPSLAIPLSVPHPTSPWYVPSHATVNPLTLPINSRPPQPPGKSAGQTPSPSHTSITPPPTNHDGKSPVECPRSRCTLCPVPRRVMRSSSSILRRRLSSSSSRVQDRKVERKRSARVIC